MIQTTEVKKLQWVLVHLWVVSTCIQFASLDASTDTDMMEVSINKGLEPLLSVLTTLTQM